MNYPKDFKPIPRNAPWQLHLAINPRNGTNPNAVHIMGCVRNPYTGYVYNSEITNGGYERGGWWHISNHVSRTSAWKKAELMRKLITSDRDSRIIWEGIIHDGNASDKFYSGSYYKINTDIQADWKNEQQKEAAWARKHGFA